MIQSRLGYPAGAIPLAVSSAVMANADAVAALPAVVGRINVVTGYSVSGTGATGAGFKQVAITGLAIPASVNTGIAPLDVTFPLPIAAAAPNAAVTLTVPAFGAGGTNARCTLFGYSLPA